METNILIGISACLLGEHVRYDGGHKRDPFIIDSLGKVVDFVPVCPEAECGLGVPREVMRLVGNWEDPRIITIHSHLDHTQQLKAWTYRRLTALSPIGLSGFIFKSNSPSCGLSEVDVFNENGIPIKKGIGLFARELIKRFPHLPAIDEINIRQEVFLNHFSKGWFDSPQ